MDGLSENSIQNIKQAVEAVFGQKINYAKDCDSLSVRVFEKTNRQLSASTLKRFWGIIRSRFNPSGFTLDTLALFVGYAGWDHFASHTASQIEKPAEQIVQSPTKTRVDEITMGCLLALKERTKNHLLLERDFATPLFDGFLQSDKAVLPIIAPSDYGKSALIIQFIEKYLPSRSAYNNTIICLIDGSFINHLIDQKQGFDQWLRDTCLFEMEDNYIENNTPNIVVIIDQLHALNYYYYFVDYFITELAAIISEYSGKVWFKLIISCRTDLWKRLHNFFAIERPELNDVWYNIDVEQAPVIYSNIPYLTDSEIERELKLTNYAFAFDKLKFSNPLVTEIIREPYMFNLFVTNFKQVSACTEIDLLTQYYEKKILTTIQGADKSQIIETILRVIHRNIQSLHVKRNELLLAEMFRPAYDDLIAHGILVERSEKGKYLAIDHYVSFANTVFLEFILTNFWLQNHTYDSQLIANVLVFYEKNAALQSNVVRWLVRYAFKEKRIDVLTEVFEIFGNYMNNQQNTYFQNHQLLECVQTIGNELRHNANLRNLLIPKYTRLDFAKQFYFEMFFDLDFLVLNFGDAIENYAAYNLMPHEQMFAHGLLFNKFVLANDIDKIKEEHAIIETFNYDKSLAAYYFKYVTPAKITYNYIETNTVSHELIGEALSYIEYFIDSEYIAQVLVEIALMDAFYRTMQYKYIVQLFAESGIHNQSSQAGVNVYQQLVKLYYAHALLKTGDRDTAFKELPNIDSSRLPLGVRVYFTIVSRLIKTDFLSEQNRLNEAIHLLNSVIEMATHLRFRYFIVIAEKRKSEISMYLKFR